MRLDLFQRVERRVPIVALAAKQRVGMNAGVFGQALLGEPRLFQGVTKPLDEMIDHERLESTFPCAFQEQKHTGMYRPSIMFRRMEKTPEQRRTILWDFINERGLRRAEWAKRSGVNKNSVYNFLNGHSEALDMMTYAKLARAEQVPIWRLTGETPEAPGPSTIWVVGQVEAGAFADAVEWDQSKWYPVDVPVPHRFRSVAKALEVRGPSMNLEYPEGSVVIWVDMLDARPPRHQDHVIVYSYCDDDTIEATVKEYRQADGKEWLWPRSDRPEHQLPLEVANPPARIRAIEIKGLVLGGYKPRII